jgi:TonB family protein
MFDYSIGHYQKHPPNKRLFLAWIASCLAHACAVLILVKYPQLLEGGMNLWFRPPGHGSPPAETEQWRNVALLGSKMEMPSREVLKKYVYDWNRKSAKKEETPSIRVNIPVKPAEAPPPAPKPRPEAPAAPGTSAAAAPAVPIASTPPVSQGDASHIEVPNEAKKPPTPPASPPDVAPKEIPKGIAAPPSGSALPSGSGSTSASQARSQNKGAQEQQTGGVRVEGGATYDAKGFPLDQYINVIKELAKGNWEIPSNLRNSQGSTTILFYISKNGNSTGARIDVSSGNLSLDIAALSAVLKSNPFPPLPVGFPADRVGVRFVFAYNERK